MNGDQASIILVAALTCTAIIATSAAIYAARNRLAKAHELRERTERRLRTLETWHHKAGHLNADLIRDLMRSEINQASVQDDIDRTYQMLRGGSQSATPSGKTRS